MQVYRHLAQCLQAVINCEQSNNTEWAQKHKAEIVRTVVNYLPSGSGFDKGCSLDLDKSTPESLVINTSFHHMDDNGYYSGWTEHTIRVKPSLAFGFLLSISGRDVNEIKAHIEQTFDMALTQEIK